MTGVRLRAIAFLALCVAALGAMSATALGQWFLPVGEALVPLAMDIGPLPQCDYGHGYEHPLLVRLESGGDVVAQAETGGIYTGPGSLMVPLRAPSVGSGTYRLRVGRCPSLRDAPVEALRCDAPEWIESRRVRVEAREGNAAVRVEVSAWRERCM